MNRSARFLAPTLVSALLALAMLLSIPAVAAVWLDPLHKDTGSYSVYGGSRRLGSEKFTLEPHGDSVMIVTNVDQMIPTPRGDQQLTKKVLITVAALDFDLLDYRSESSWLGVKVMRGIAVSETTFTSYHESNRRGYGDTDLKPPGRVFIIEPQAFATFDALLRGLHGKLISEREVGVIMVSEPHDTVLTIKVVPGPRETIQWNGAPTATSRVTLTDGSSNFVAWVSSKGRMLRLEEPRSGLRVERDPSAADSAAARRSARAAAKAAKKPAPKPPGGR